jgi:hypothetical protein
MILGGGGPEAQLLERLVSGRETRRENESMARSLVVLVQGGRGPAACLILIWVGLVNIASLLPNNLYLNINRINLNIKCNSTSKVVAPLALDRLAALTVAVVC